MTWIWIALGVVAYTWFVVVVMRFCAAVKRGDADAAKSRRNRWQGGARVPEPEALTVDDVLDGGRAEDPSPSGRR